MTIQDYDSQCHYEPDPTALRGLMQAVYISERLCSGDSEEMVVARFGGDEQLVRMWISFLRHSRWAEYDLFSQRWTMTKKGEERCLDRKRQPMSF